VMSDHGFSTFDRAVHLNTWLMREGFLSLQEGATPSDDELFAHVDWSKTQAYALGLNGIYLNLRGRERTGVVEPGIQADITLRVISRRLRDYRDPKTGQPVVSDVFVPSEAYAGKEALTTAPDLIAGYAPGYRCSWQSAMGAVPPETVVDNNDAWIGDHCISPRHVPGVLLSNRPVRLQDPALADLTATLLGLFEVRPPADMTGRQVF
jgi:predicted AlkP superfamily phosphohydrolase/phosphomutase